MDHRLHVRKPHAAVTPPSWPLRRLILSFSLIRGIDLLSTQGSQGHIQRVNKHGETHVDECIHGKAPVDLDINKAGK